MIRFLNQLARRSAGASAALATGLAVLSSAHAQSTPTVSCSTDPAIFNTGIDGTNGYSINSPKLPLGATDAHWFIAPADGPVTNASTAAGLSYTQGPLYRHPAWYPSPFNNAEWIGVSWGKSYYVYRYQFNLDPSVDPAGFNLNLSMYADNQVSRILVNDAVNDYTNNGTSLGIGGFQSNGKVSLVLNAGWKTGLNTLYVVTGNQGDPSGLLVQSTGTASCAPPLNVQKKAVNADGTPFTGRATANGLIYYDVTVTNASSGNASGTVLKDSLPAGLQSAASSWSCSVPAGSAAVCPAPTPNTLPINTSLPNLPAGSSLVFRVNSRFSNPLPAGQALITNTATIEPPAASGLTCDPRDGFPTPCSASASVGTAPLVRVSKSVASPGPLYPGDTAVYTVTVTNEGAADLANTALSDTLPAGFASAAWTCQSPVGSQAVCPAASGSLAAGGTLSQTIAAMKANASLVYTITATVANITSPAPGVVNTAQVTASEADALCVNPDGTTSSTKPCSASAPVTLWPLPVLELTKTVAGAGTFYAGQPVVYTITAKNAGQVPVSNAKVADALPAGLVNGSWTCAPGASTPCPSASGSAPLDATLPALAAGDSVVFTVSATVAAQPPASITNTATLDADAKNSQCQQGGAIAGTVPCQAAQTIQTAALPVLAISKTVDATAPLSPGDALTYTVTVRNSGAGDLSQVTITDPLPPNIELGAWTCTATGAATCPAASGSGALNQSVALLPAGTSLVYTLAAKIGAQAPAGTTLVNEASAASAAAATQCEGGTPQPCKASASVSTKSTLPGGAAPVPMDKPWALLLLSVVLLAGVLRQRQRG